MMKSLIRKWNTQLLERYPLLWNIRLPQLLCGTLCLHLVHFLLGYLWFDSAAGMRWHNPEDVFFTSTVAMFSMIASLLVFILWLGRYARNNALLSFYPVSRNWLYGEFVLLLLISFLNLSYYLSFTMGFVTHGRNATDYHLALTGSRIRDRVAAFVQEGQNRYELEQRCYPAPFPVSRQYSGTSADGRVLQDTFCYAGSDGKTYSRNAIRELTGSVQYSYLNYCYYNNYRNNRDNVTADSGSGRYGAQRWLLRQDSAALKAGLDSFILLCRTTGIRYHIDAAEWFRWIWHPPYYPVTYTLKHLSDSRLPGDEGDNRFNPSGFYLEEERLGYIIGNTLKLHEHRFKLWQFNLFLYMALCFSVLLLTFRLSGARSWLISLLAFCVLLLAVGTITALGISLHLPPKALALFYLLLIPAFLLVSMISPARTLAGLSLNWFCWSALIWLPLLVWFLQAALEEPVWLFWVSLNYDLFLLINSLVYIVMMYLLVPRFRSRQAMTER